LSDQAIVKEYNDLYEEAYYSMNPFYPLANNDLRFYLGDQWQTGEKQKLFEEGRNAFSFNLIRRNINLLTGYQRKHRLSSVVVPMESNDQEAADQFSQLLLYAMNSGDGYRNISEGFGGALKTGFNLVNIWMDYRDDPINGDIRYGREPYNGFIVDPYFTNLDFSDCSYVIKRKYLSADQAASLLPGQEKEIHDLAAMSQSKDDKFTWLPYQRQPNGKDFVSYNELYKQSWEQVPALVDEETGEYMEWEGDTKGIKIFLSKYPQLKLIKRPKKVIECFTIVNETFMRKETNQYGLNEYPFVPMVGLFEPEAEGWDLKMQSLVRCQLDPQREANRRRSQMIDVLDSSINSGWMAKKSAVINPRSLFQTSQGRVIWKEDDAQPGDIEKIPPAQIPPSMFELQRQFDQDIMNILGVNDASFGETENAQESGVMMMLRQSASIVNLQDIFDNLRYAQKLLAKKTLKLIQTWTPEKVERIINAKPSQQFYDKEFIKYDVSVQEGVLTDTQRQMYFRQLVDLKNLGVPVTGEMLSEAAPLQGKTEYNKQIAANEQQQAKQQQQAADVQNKVLNSELELNKATSIDRLATASERQGRLRSNLALATERISESEQNRSQAALDRAKTMTEIGKMEDDRIMQIWNFINTLEQQETTDRELIGQKVQNQAQEISSTEQNELNANKETVQPQQQGSVQ